MNKTAISIQGLTKTFSARAFLQILMKDPPRRGVTEVLKGVSLEVSAGEAVGLLGPNGAGKTTLVEILSTLLLPTSGRASVCGYDVVSEAARVTGVIGYCPSTVETFYPRLTGAANLEFFAMLKDLEPRQARKRIAELLELLSIDGATRLAFQRCSEGMKQRVSLARALLTDPPVLLLDEPTKSLDPLLQAEIRKFLRKTVVDKLGKTVLLITHDLAEAEQVCHRLAILHQGRIVGVGTPGQIRAAFGTEGLAGAFMHAVGAN
jgi:ABC-2 type transport system ATP-binding protein